MFLHGKNADIWIKKDNKDERNPQIESKLEYWKDDSMVTLHFDPSTLKHLEDINTKICSTLSNDQTEMLEKLKNIYGLHNCLIQIDTKYKNHLQRLEELKKEDNELKTLKAVVSTGTASNRDIIRLQELDQNIKTTREFEEKLKKEIENDQKEITTVINLLDVKVTFLINQKETETQSLKDYLNWVKKDTGAISSLNEVQEKFRTT